MVPKIIHYCWMGEQEYPELIKRCIASWREKLSDYEIVCWDSDRFDVNSNSYTKEAYESKKYAFVSDYIRLYALYNYGGIYLDCDVEVLKSIDDLLDNKAFTSFETDHSVATWLLATEKGNPIFKEFLDYYDGRHFSLPDGGMDLTPNPVPITKICVRNGLILNNERQDLKWMTVYPKDYFCPYDHIKDQLEVTDHSYTIHYFNGTWFTEDQKRRKAKRQKITKKYGKLIGYLYYGGSLLIQEGMGKFMKEFRFFIKK